MEFYYDESLRNTVDQRKAYGKLVQELIKESVNWVAIKTCRHSYGMSIQKGRKQAIGIPVLPKFNYELPLELKKRLYESLLVHRMWSS